MWGKFIYYKAIFSLLFYNLARWHITWYKFVSIIKEPYLHIFSEFKIKPPIPGSKLLKISHWRMVRCKKYSNLYYIDKNLFWWYDHILKSKLAYIITYMYMRWILRMLKKLSGGSKSISFGIITDIVGRVMDFFSLYLKIILYPRKILLEVWNLLFL